jgi:hypothetical protein
MTMTKIDRITAVNATLAEITATAEKMTLDERQSLLASLTESVRIDAGAVDASKRRLESIKAAASNPAKQKAFAGAVMGLRRLGLEIEAIAASGSIQDLDRAMDTAKWSQNQRFALKTHLAAVGALEK